MKNSKIITGIIFFLVAIIFFQNCKKKEIPEPTPPSNPYDGVNYDSSTTLPATPDPNSFVGIHTNILRVRCAIPGCHVGNFEPDFRTVESAYSTLVWHKINKNSADSAYTFRVVPYNVEKSVIYQRLTNCNFAYVGANDCMPQDNIGTKLPQNMIDNISTWISNGAKDMFGNSPTYPNTEPKILYYYATNTSFNINYGTTENRIDSIYYNPFYIPDSTTFYMILFVEDDSTTAANMQVNKLKISQSPDNFSSAINFNATYINIPPNPPFHLCTLNTALFPKNDTLFMRYIVNDGNHTNDTYFPTENLPFPYKTYWSFFIKP